MAHPLDNKKLLEDLYLVKRLSLRQIEKKTNYSRRVVTQYIKKHSIPQRTHSASLSDQYTPFRFYLKGVYRARYKNALRRSRLIPKKGKCLTLPYLKGLWEKQNGTCPYTGIKLKLFTHSKAKYGESKHNFSPSQACDTLPMAGGKYLWKDKAIQKAYAKLVMDTAWGLGYKWKWGGAFKSFYDGPHMERID
jgi:hypothetical protein